MKINALEWRRWRRSGVFIVNFEHILDTADFEQGNADWELCRWLYINANSTLIINTLCMLKKSHESWSVDSSG